MPFTDEKKLPQRPPQNKVDKQVTFVNSPLHDACRKGNRDLVIRLVSQGLVDINSRDVNHGKTPLMVAAQEGHCRIFDFLVRKGANKSQVDNDGNNILHWACKGGHVGMVKCLLPHYGVAIKKRFMSLLFHAAWHGFRDVCEFLVCMGASVSQVDVAGYNVLHWACKGGNLDVVKYLLSLCSVDINSRGNRGMTPMMAAALRGHTSILKFLGSMGANRTLVADNGDSVLLLACKGKRMVMVKYLIGQCGLEINSKGEGGMTPLMAAASIGDRHMFHYIWKNGANTSLVDDTGDNILHLASLKGHLVIVKLIVRNHLVNIKARNKDGETASMMAKHHSKSHVYSFLVSQGCPMT
ncbi:ankyrin repeat, PH and SEC7 domain containing protein secG-like [Haliotis asinina]|uniref:ankyrin repeat, PH and SEC7 domain containing protein secG-like n=1 Tax=Haliotis asinina TaxID=109174 RepID=UPI003531DCC9